MNSKALLLNIAIQEASYHRARSSRNPQVATIDSSSPSSDLVPPRASTEHIPPQSSSRPTSRRSNINSQLFQFALGYPQTPPDTTPERDSITSLLDGNSSGTQSNMGSFLFRWYVATNFQSPAHKDPWAAYWSLSSHRLGDCVKAPLRGRSLLKLIHLVSQLRDFAC